MRDRKERRAHATLALRKRDLHRAKVGPALALLIHTVMVWNRRAAEIDGADSAATTAQVLNADAGLVQLVREHERNQMPELRAGKRYRHMPDLVGADGGARIAPVFLLMGEITTRRRSRITGRSVRPST